MILSSDVGLGDRDIVLPPDEDPGAGDRLERRIEPAGALGAGMIIPLLLVTVAGACLRLLDLSSQSLWQDEAFSWRISQFSWPEIIRRTAEDTHPPLYYLALRSWISALGDSVGVMRSLSAICGIINICIVYLFTYNISKSINVSRSVGRRWVATLAALLAALSPFLVARDREMRMYAPGCLLATASSWALWRALDRPGATIGAWSTYVVLAVGLVYTHNFGLFTVAAQAVFASGLLVSGTLRDGMTRSRSHRLLATAMAFLAIALAYAPWVPALVAQDRRVVAVFRILPLNLDSIGRSMDQLFTGFTEADTPLTDGASSLFVAGVIVALMVGRRAEDLYLVLLIATPLVLSITISVLQGRNIFLGRCLTFTVPFLAIAVARLVGQVPPGFARRAIVAALILEVAMAQWWLWRHRWIGDRPGLRAAVDAIARDYREGDAVFSFNGGGEHLAMRYYAKGRFKPLILLRDGQRPRHYHGSAVLADDELLDADLAVRNGTSRVWLLLSPANRSRRLFWDDGAWKMIDSKSFAESAPFRRDEVQLDLWVRKDAPDGGGRRGAASSRLGRSLALPISRFRVSKEPHPGPPESRAWSRGSPTDPRGFAWVEGSCPLSSR
jgi:mannosyltransferase